GRARVGAEAIDPVGKRRAARVEEPRDLLVREMDGELHGRQLRAVEDLVGVGVADAAQDARIGEGALERMTLARERGAERWEVGVEHLEPAAIELAQGVSATQQ